MPASPESPANSKETTFVYNIRARAGLGWPPSKGEFYDEHNFETIGNLRERENVAARLSPRIGFVSGQFWCGFGRGIPGKHDQSHFSAGQRSAKIG
jgi:hypothetical protein